MAKIFLRKKITERIGRGHPWVFANEIGDESGHYQAGDIVSVFSSNGSFVGKGYINPASQIRVRLLTRKAETVINGLFFFQHIEAAWRFRQKLGYGSCCRVVFSEADNLPGLIVDKFEDCLVFQTLSLGMDIRKPVITKALTDIFNTRKIYEQNKVPVRLLEGLPLQKGFTGENFPNPVSVTMDDLRFKIDIINGGKTGFFWEQREISKALKPIAGNAEVLDVFCHSGFCGLQAAKHGAIKITAIDNDSAALSLAKENAEGNNGLPEKIEFAEGNAFDLLKAWSKQGLKYDIVILNPPALAQSNKNLAKAVAGYKELNLRAMKLLRPEGFLLTCCSSFLLTESMMVSLLQETAKDAGRQVRVVGKINQAADHPVLWNLPSTHYFKGLLLAVNELTDFSA